MVSEGLDPYEEITLPKFDSTWSKTSIERWLEQNDIDNFTFRNVESTEIPGNYLISYRLIGATEENFMRNSEIEFTISHIDEVETVTVYDFLNRSLTEVDIWAKNNGINYTYSYDFSSIYDRDKIMYQSFTSGEEMDVDETISFIISKGEEIILPSFSNMNIDEARNYSQEDEISVEVIESYQEGTNVGDFIYQSIPAGTKVEEGTSIKVMYSLGDTIVVPNYTGQLKVDFEEWVREINRLGASITLTIREDSNSGMGYGRIISQNIYNENVGLKANIGLVVSSGIRVPSFLNMSADEARSYSEEGGISVEVIEKYKTGTNVGDFISQSIQSGTKVEEGTKIKVIYSLGDKVRIPNYINQLSVDFEDWVREINQMGASIILTTKEDSNSRVGYGKIISQNIYNEYVDLSTNIKLIVSSGIRVPSFSDMSVDEARSYSEEGGISVEVIEKYKTGTNVGDFISQTIPAGTKVEEDTSITVYYSLGNTVTIPNYTGQLKIDFEEWVREQNEMGASITLTVHEDYVDNYIFNENIEYGRIIRQNIYNDNVDLSTNIEILVSLGEEYRVTDFSLYSRPSIQSFTEQQGLMIVVEEVSDTGLPSGTFISQEPEAGEIISKKDFIKIRVAE